MYGSPFCFHVFSAEQLAASDVVSCDCGHTFKSSDLSEFTRIKGVIDKSNLELSSLVQEMASFNSVSRAPAKTVAPAKAVAPVIEEVRPPKPTRPKVTLSLTQWLIVAAGFFIFAAASIFVGQNINTWNVFAWSTLEASLAVLTGFGALKLKKFSVLLTNFLAAFSSVMLSTFIMTISTTFGWGFGVWNQEPLWFWSVNLAVVALVSLGLGMVSKNFGWRALAPLSLTASAFLLVSNSGVGYEDNWRTAILSVALFAILITVRLARNATWTIPEDTDGAEYLENLRQNEDNALKRFGVFTAIALGGLSLLSTVALLLLRFGQPLDGLATILTAVVWLVGARINHTWVSAIVDKEETILKLRNTASAVGLSFLGIGVLSAIYGVSPQVGIFVAIALLLLVFALERYAKFLLLPTYSVTISAWITLVFGSAWYVIAVPTDPLLWFAIYALSMTVALGAREYFNFSSLRVNVLYATGLLGAVLGYLHFQQHQDPNSIGYAVTLALGLVAVNASVPLVTWLRSRNDVENSVLVTWLTVFQSSLLILISLPNFIGGTPKLYLLFLAAGFLIVMLLGKLKLKSEELRSAVGNHVYVALAITLFITVTSFTVEALKINSAFILFDGLAIFGYALLAKNIRWANIGYAVTSLSIIFANLAWGTNSSTVAWVTVLAIAAGAAANLGLIWATSEFGKANAVTKLVTRITTGLSLLVIIQSVARFTQLDDASQWIIWSAPLIAALVIEFRSKNNFAFVYAGAAFLACTEHYVAGSVQLLTRLALTTVFFGYLFIVRARASKQIAWVVGSQAAAGITGLLITRILINQFQLNWEGPEIYTLPVAILFALSATLTKPANGKAHQTMQLDFPILFAAVPSLVFGAILSAGTEQYFAGSPLPLLTRTALTSALFGSLFIVRARASKLIGWVVGSQAAAGITGLLITRILINQFQLNWEGPEIYTLPVAILFALSATLTKPANGKAHQTMQLDFPILFAAVPSLVFGALSLSGDMLANGNRMAFAAAAIWGHNVWRTLQRRKTGWLVAQSITGLVFALAIVRDLYLQTNLVWNGPELYSVAVLGTALVGIWLAGKMELLQGSLVRTGLPVAILLTPSAIFSWTSITMQFSQLDGIEITRTLLVLLLAIACMVFGILRQNRGLNLVGTAELWLIAVPGLWFKTDAIDNGSTSLELRGLLLGGLVYWAIALVRKYTDFKAKSLVWVGVPVTIALAPAVLHTLSSLGGTEFRTVDWWRFSIVLTVSVVLLVVGALREMGGTFFPGLISVLVTVVPYVFTPVTNKEWFLWAILLAVAGLLVWLAVRLENMRKAGREPSVWLQELK